MIGTTIALITLATAAATAGGAVGAAKINSGAAKDAANAQGKALEKSTALQTAAQTSAAGQQTQSAAEALAFQKQQAAYDATVAETNRHANYDQYTDRQNMLGSVGEALGLPHRNVSPYVPLPASPYAMTPGQALGQQPGPGGAPGGTPGPTSGNLADPALIHAQLEGIYRNLGVAPTGPGTGPTDIAYMAGKIKDTGGWTPENASYWPGRIADELKKAGGGSTAPTTATNGNVYRPMGTPFGGTVQDYLQRQPITGNLRMPPIGQSVGSYF